MVCDAFISESLLVTCSHHGYGGGDGRFVRQVAIRSARCDVRAAALGRLPDAPQPRGRGALDPAVVRNQGGRM